MYSHISCFVLVYILVHICIIFITTIHITDYLERNLLKKYEWHFVKTTLQPGSTNLHPLQRRPPYIHHPLSPYSTENCVFVGYPMQIKSTQKYEMYMPNAKTQHQGPNATYIPLAGVGVLRRGKRKFYVLYFQIPTCWYPQCKIVALGG